MNPSAYGWDPPFESEFESYRACGLEHARVVREERGRYLLVVETQGEIPGEISGRFRTEARTTEAFPTVGDWVAVRLTPEGDRAIIHGLVKRRTAFRRKVAGDRADVQVLAANVDVVFLVTGLDGNFNLRRIERYLSLTYACGASPVVVLNKSDLEDDLELRIRQVEGLTPGTSVCATSAADGTGVDRLGRHLGRGRTGAFLGSSGVGKSSLINRLLGHARQDTGAVREADSRGRHVTTRRELLLLPNDGGLVMDTPGLREIQLAGDADRALESFHDVLEAAARCRFRDCRHQGEPECGVRRALLDGTLDTDRYESFLEQQRELAYQARRSDRHARQAERARWRKITINQRKRRNAHRHER